MSTAHAHAHLPPRYAPERRRRARLRVPAKSVAGTWTFPSPACLAAMRGHTFIPPRPLAASGHVLQQISRLRHLVHLTSLLHDSSTDAQTLPVTQTSPHLLIHHSLVQSLVYTHWIRPGKHAH